MRNNGFTLLELAITSMVVIPIILLGVTSLFVTEYNLRAVMQDYAAVSREAQVAMDHMTRVIRFSDNAQIAGNTVTAHLEPGHLVYPSTGLAADIVYTYSGADKNILVNDGSSWNYTLANHIDSFLVTWASPLATINITAKKGEARVDLQTKVRSLAAA